MSLSFPTSPSLLLPPLLCMCVCVCGLIILARPDQVQGHSKQPPPLRSPGPARLAVYTGFGDLRGGVSLSLQPQFVRSGWGAVGSGGGVCVKNQQPLTVSHNSMTPK